MSEHNKTLMRRAVEEVWNQGNVDILEELVASDFIIHAPQAEIHGREGAKQYLAMLRGGFPDIHFTIEDQFADGDRVMTRWKARGTHKGAFQGIPPATRRSGWREPTLSASPMARSWNVGSVRMTWAYCNSLASFLRQNTQVSSKFG